MGNSSSQMAMRPQLRKHYRWHQSRSLKHSGTLSRSPSPTLLDLPEYIHHRIIRELGERDRKSLSIVCFHFLQCCEQTFERAPRIWTPIGGSWATSGDRIIIESEYTEDSERPEPRWARELGTYRLKSPPYTSKDELSRPVRFRKHSPQAQEEERMWLCSHVGCTFDNLKSLPKTPSTSVRDTRSIACAFPKCALWARHATVPAGWGARTSELCSIFKVYRVQCSHAHPKDLRQKLLSIAQDRLQNAMQHLRMPVCCHLNLGSTALTAYFNPKQMVIIPQIQDFNWNEAAKFCFDVGSCEDCRSEGTYTTWGFFAQTCRSDASHGGIAWLDIELALARPYMGASDLHNDRHKRIHWDAHAIPPAAMSNFVDGWWKWAEHVAIEGFDWRARLPSGFLEANRSACINFPELLPAYEEHDSNFEFAEDEQILQTRLGPLENQPHSTWGWRACAGFESIHGFSVSRIIL